MKKIILFTLFFIIAGTNSSSACSLLAGYEIPMKNDIVTAVANKYRADINESEIKITDYYHDTLWKFNDFGFSCPDTYTYSMTISMTYKMAWDPNKTCETEVEVDQTAGPKVKDGPYIIERTMTEVSNTCQ